MAGGQGGVVSCFHVGDSFVEVRGGLKCIGSLPGYCTPKMCHIKVLLHPNCLFRVTFTVQPFLRPFLLSILFCIF